MNNPPPQLFVLPEDDANRHLAQGFKLYYAVDTRKIKILPIAGGWMKVLDKFTQDQVGDMLRYPRRTMILLIDFDERVRLPYARGRIPDELRERVFILGTRDDPEDLEKKLKIGSLEDIGRALARDCHEHSGEVWNHPQLTHNDAEVNRLSAAVRSWLFP